MLLNILQCTTRPLAENDTVQDVSGDSAEAGGLEVAVFAHMPAGEGKHSCK